MVSDDHPLLFQAEAKQRIRYGFRMTQPDFPTQTYQYHRDTYGKDFNYDDFMSIFTDTHFDAQEWMNVIAGSGAQYFVPVTSKQLPYLCISQRC